MANIYGEKSTLRQQWEKMKDQPAREKAGWILHYFGVYIFVGLLFLGVVITILVTVLRPRPSVLFNGLFFDVDFSKEKEKELSDALLELMDAPDGTVLEVVGEFLAEDDPEYLYYQVQSVEARISTKTLDVLGAYGDILTGFLDTEEPDTSFLAPLKEILSKEHYETLRNAGRLRFVKTDEGEMSFMVLASGSRLAEILGVKSDYWIAVSITAPHEEAVDALMELILEPSI